MLRPRLTGTRIRDRRLQIGLRQSELARQIGISASYLNLIEHNRRRIAGRVLNDIARALGADVEALTEGAEATLLNALKEVASAGNLPQQGPPPEIDKMEDFAGRFPGWASLLAETHAQTRSLSRSVAALNDRIAHDPDLSASLHAVLSAVTSIRSTSAILAETDDLDPEWQGRFHRNLADDSARLSENAEALVRYLDADADSPGDAATPQEEVEAYFTAQGFHFAQIEERGVKAIKEVVDAAMPPLSGPAQRLANAILQRYAQAAKQLTLDDTRAALAQHGFDLMALARALECDLFTLFRRLASMAPGDLAQPVGLVVCDGAGALVFRKSLNGFALPRYGAGCPLWPLYQALASPAEPIRAELHMAGREDARFTAYAYCQPVQPAEFGSPSVREAAMLIVPSTQDLSQSRPIGPTCRLCPRDKCPARREPSVVAQDAVLPDSLTVG